MQYALDRIQIWHAVKATKGINGGVQALTICGHLFVATKIQSKKPERKFICFGCLDAMERKP